MVSTTSVAVGELADRAMKWIPVKVVRIVAAMIYAILGVVTLLGYSRVSL